MKKNSIVLLLVALMTATMATAAASAAIPVEITKVEVNGFDLASMSGYEDVNRGEEIEVEVYLHALGDIDNGEIEVSIDGYRYKAYEHELVTDYQRFKMNNDSNRKFTFQLEVPVKMDKDSFDLRVQITGRTGDVLEELFPIGVSGLDEEDAIVIKEFSVSPSTVVEAGRPLSFKVKVKNYGDDDLDDISVKVAIPALGIADDEYLDELNADETETFEELLLRIPQCVDPGTYTVEATVMFDEYQVTKQTMTITVLEGDVCGGTADEDDKKPTSKTVVTVPESQEVVMGTTGGVYPVMISNLGSTAKTYTLTASGIDAWGTVRFDPAAVVVVQPESVKTVYMYVAAKEDAQAGAQVFKLTVESEEESKQVVLTANVGEGDTASYDSLRRGLEIGLIILVVILIILGLIIGFNKIRGDRGDYDEESQTYY
ncbi:hypothetical protein JXA12_01810 [Candidatus Woesearchaeota archaeon]|nr:hypothetical protein [Candidatus Woesearchaeota archaeon]